MFTNGNFRKLIIGLLIFIWMSGCGHVFGTGGIIYIYVGALMTHVFGTGVAGKIMYERI